VKLGMRIFIPLTILLLTVPNCAVGQELSSSSSSKKPDLSTVIVQAPFGFWYPSSFFNQPPNVYATTSYYGINIIGLPSNPPLLGHFDKNGKVVNGDYVLVLYLDLNTAPITKVWFSGGWATVGQPVATLTASIRDGQPLVQYSFNMGTASDAQISGTEGTVYLGIALLKRANQPLHTAWGATLSQVIRIDDTIPSFPSGNYILPMQYGTASFTIGGAAHFSRR
jgi:hypothetical protein